MYVGCIRFDFWKTTTEVIGQLLTKVDFFLSFYNYMLKVRKYKKSFFLSWNTPKRPMKLFTNLHHHHFLKAREEICKTKLVFLSTYLKARKIIMRFPDLYMHHGVERKNSIFSSCKMIPYYAELSTSTAYVYQLNFTK